MLARRLGAEALGTGLLVVIIIGAGIMAARLAGGNEGLALFGDAVPTAAMLVVIVTIFSPISGAHFNPVVSLVFAIRGDLPWRQLAPYIIAQCLGAISGAVVAHLMFDLAPSPSEATSA